MTDPGPFCDRSTTPLFDLAGKVAVVTGGSSGIGFMIARGLLQAGAARVYIGSRRPDEAEAAVERLAEDGEAVYVEADVGAEADCESMVETVSGRESALHILVNNAGVGWRAPIEEFGAKGWDKVVDVNLKAPFFLIRSFLPLLEAAGTLNDPARVINIGSIDGMRVSGLPTYSYAATKAGLHHLTRVLARELGPKAITVNAIAPGPFDTPMLRASEEGLAERLAASSPLGRIGRADDIAATAVYLAAHGGSYTTGVILPVDGGIYSTA